MIIEFAADDGVLNQVSFQRDEAAYNLLHLIVESRSALRLTNRTKKLVCAMTPGHNAWLWIAEQAADEEREQLLRQLIAYMQRNDVRLPGVTGLPQTVATFAERYGAAQGMASDLHMAMESYACPSAPRKPLHVQGRIRLASRLDAPLVASNLAAFAEEALGGHSDPASHLAAAESMASSGNLYLWAVGDEVVSMAHIAHRSRRHGRINSVYTPRLHRQQGYASAIVAELCDILRGEKLIPMLYADRSNPDANRVYRKSGFVPAGVLHDIRFSDSGRRDVDHARC